MEAVYLYNMSPSSGQDEKSIPKISVFSYVCRQPGNKRERSEKDLISSSPVKSGKKVWVKPPHSTCTSQWSKREVTAFNSKCNVDIDGTPRHILDIRKVVLPHCPVTESSSEDEMDEC